MRLWAVPTAGKSHKTDGVRPFQLPIRLPEFILQRCRSIGMSHDEIAALCMECDKRRPGAQPSFVHGLLKVQVGAHFEGHLTEGWGRECEFLREYFASTTDAYCIRIEEAWVVPVWEQKPEIDSVVRKRHRQNNLRGERLQVTSLRKGADQHLRLVASWAAPRSADMLSLQPAASVGAPVFQTMCDILGLDFDSLSVPFLKIPPLIWKLISHNMWTELVSLARWPIDNDEGMAFSADSLPPDWVGRFAGKHDIDDGQELLSHNMADHVIGVVRAEAASRLDRFPDDEERAGERMHLERLVGSLRSHQRAIDSSSIDRRGFKLQHTSGILVQQVLASLDLRSRATLRRTANACLQACLPGDIGSLLQPWVEKIVCSPSGLQRSRVSLDLALLKFHQKQVNCLGRILRYGWGDGTFMRGCEWYNTRYRFISESDVVALARASKWLTKHPAVGPSPDVNEGEEMDAGRAADDDEDADDEDAGFVPDSDAGVGPDELCFLRAGFRGKCLISVESG